MEVTKDEKFEIDMLSVGAADAILIRYFNKKGYEYIICIDAGNPSDGKKAVDHIKKYYNQDYIDLAVCTHPDTDHIGGFDYILDNIKIKEFWIHDPEKHVKLEEVKNKLKEHTLSKSLSYITETLDNNINILDKIDKLNIPRKEPFTGVSHSSIPLVVMGPTETFYTDLLKRFRESDLIFEELDSIEKGFLDEVDVTETLSATLDSENDPSAENNSSAVLLFRPKSLKYLFTADAGPLALNRIIEAYPHHTNNLNWLDVPHHGSKRSLTSNLIKHFSPTVAYVSAQSKKRYLSQAVINAFTKVGTKIYSTHNSGNIWHHRGTDERGDYSSLEPINKDKLDGNT